MTSQLSLSTTLDTFVLLVLHTFNIAIVSYIVTSMKEIFDSPSHTLTQCINIATVSYSASLYSVSVTHSSVCMSRAVHTVLITVTELGAVTQEGVPARGMVKR